MDVRQAVTVSGICPIVDKETGKGWQIKGANALMQVTYWNLGPPAFGGRHYHPVGSKDVSKSPEIFFLASGRIKLVWWVLGASEKFSRIVEAGSLVEIPTGIAHTVYYLEKSVLVEHRITGYCQENDDTVKLTPAAEPDTEIAL